jgi:hypothetical protein
MDNPNSKTAIGHTLHTYGTYLGWNNLCPYIIIQLGIPIEPALSNAFLFSVGTPGG